MIAWSIVTQPARCNGAPQGVYDQTAFTNSQHIPASVLTQINVALKGGAR